MRASGADPPKKPDFTFTIITGDLGLGGNIGGNIIFIEFSDKLDNIFAGKSGIIAGFGFGFNVGIEGGGGFGQGDFVQELDPYENPLEKFDSATSLEIGLPAQLGTLPVGTNITDVSGYSGSDEIYKASYQTITIGYSFKKFGLDPVMDKIKLPSVIASPDDASTILKNLPTPTKEDSLMLDQRLPNR